MARLGESKILEPLSVMRILLLLDDAQQNMMDNVVLLLPALS